MNYRHSYHAGNFADVLKHALLVRIMRLLQKKQAGCLYLDTHAGRGWYDLSTAARGDTLERRPEWPEGIGRLLAGAGASGREPSAFLPEAGGTAGAPSPAAQAVSALDDYLNLVRRFDRESGNRADTLRFYPGSPALMRLLVRAQDRLELWERHPEECGALRLEFGAGERAAVHEADGYGAIRACLPPAERRALILIDPPYEQAGEGAEVAGALREGLRRFPNGVFCIWYPLTERAGVEGLEPAIRAAGRAAFAAELVVDGPPPGLRGCGLLVVNPPWTLEADAAGLLDSLGSALRQGPAARHTLTWIVRETAG